MINRSLLVNSFVEMARIPSHSFHERQLVDYVKEKLVHMGVDCYEDAAGAVIGGSAGNLIARYPSKNPVRGPVALAAHLDTVAPGEGVLPKVEGNIVRSGGDTILGADDKSGVAMMLEVVRALKESGVDPLMDIEFIFTVAEEAGMLGSKQIDYSKLKSRECFVLDSSRQDGFCNEAPGSYKVNCQVVGKKAHAGVEPEKGVNAVKVIGDLIAAIESGRIDNDTTVNIGTVRGGTALNVVPDSAELGIDLRSFSVQRLDQLNDQICKICGEIQRRYGSDEQPDRLPRIDAQITNSYPPFILDANSSFIRGTRHVAEMSGMVFALRRNMAGSDAQIFAQHGIESLILPTGMKNEHTTGELLNVDVMVSYTRFLFDYVTRYEA